MHSIVNIHNSPAAELGVNLLGGKGEQQAKAAAEGSPVPAGLVLTTEVFPGIEWLSRHSNESVDQQATAVKMHLEGLGINLNSSLKQLPRSHFAFRSSATIEDLGDASFAGSFKTVLNVPYEMAFHAIYEVWASCFTIRVRQYCEKMGLATTYETIRMAVLIQPMIDCLLAGVMLSHPLGEPQSPYISVGIIRGLGENLVSGILDSQVFLIERSSWTIASYKDAKDLDIIHMMAGELGRLVESLELRRGIPQDIEFAIDRDFKCVLLQNRPIVSKRLR